MQLLLSGKIVGRLGWIFLYSLFFGFSIVFFSFNSPSLGVCFSESDRQHPLSKAFLLAQIELLSADGFRQSFQIPESVNFVFGCNSRYFFGGISAELIQS
jgi:hypothetical protein